ncbi:TnsA-like heteromeric transposase endonuclease subunit [Streptomyces sp. NPDC051561]|uniref:TnsA-like heteromeric transposase endonuclease subunit n=1 Tax=Streptomyces sp. NPDC051561 TaxID=3365658 RepID=UPI003794971C
MASDSCGLEQLVAPYAVDEGVETRLSLGQGWLRRWTTAWRFDGEEVIWALRDLESVPLFRSQLVRRFGWGTRQRHRPGLQFMVSTGRHHGFESLEEQRLLLALDFLRVREVLPQPFRLSFEHSEGRAEHIPDFLVVMADGGRWVLDVRPRALVGDADELKFAATGELTTACGWRYAVVTGWRPHVWSVLDALSAQRRPVDDPLGLQVELLAAAKEPVAFGDLVQATRLPVVARAHALHLIWHGRLAIELAEPLSDATLVSAGARRDA